MQSTVQHGRQLAPLQAAPPSDPRTDPRTRNQPPPPVTADLEGVCRDFIWGICSMGPQCKYRHELEFESMKAVLKFCHDHQNRSTGCSRSDCSYLHTSREEENLFLTTGQIPRMLVDRYTAMSHVETTATSNSEPATNGPPKNMIYDYIVQPPPPPPPLPATGSASTHSPMRQGPQMTMQNPIQGPMLNSTQGPIPASMQGPIPNSMQGPMPNLMQSPLPNQMMSLMTNSMHGTLPNPVQGAMTNSLQGTMQSPMPSSMAPLHPPMPPPPPPPHTSSMPSSRLANSAYSGVMQPQPNISIYHQAVNQASSLPPLFDPSVPPPPLPQASTNHSHKRTGDEIEAGPSKLWKPDFSNDSSCEFCVQRLIRSELNNQQIEVLALEIEQLRDELAEKIEEQEKKKMLLKAILSPDMYQLTEIYIENGSPMTRSDIYSLTNMISPAVASNNSIIHQLVDMILANNSRGLIDPMPQSSSQEDELFHLARSRSLSSESLSNLINIIRESAGASSTGFNRFVEGGSPPPRFLDAGRSYADVSKAGRAYEGGARSYATLETAAPPPPPLRAFPATCESATPAAAPPYLSVAGVGAGYSAPSQPPAPRAPLYSYPPNMANVPATPYSGAMVQPPRPPLPPQNAHNPFFLGGRYPNHTYYPPYQ